MQSDIGCRHKFGKAQQRHSVRTNQLYAAYNKGYGMFYYVLLYIFISVTFTINYLFIYMCTYTTHTQTHTRTHTHTIFSFRRPAVEPEAPEMVKCSLHPRVDLAAPRSMMSLSATVVSYVHPQMVKWIWVNHLHGCLSLSGR